MTAPTTHKVRWFATPDGQEWLPREASMRGTWGYDAKCSCGWESRTGGGTERYVRDRVRQHKWDVEHGFWQEGDNA